MLRAAAPPPAACGDLALLRLVAPKYTIGRALINSTVIPHVCISRSHCILSRSENGEWSIKDTSSYGIKINNENIPKNLNHIIKKGDVIQLDPSTGYFTYVFHDKENENVPSLSPLPACSKRKTDSLENVNNNINWKKARLISNENSRETVKVSKTEKVLDKNDKIVNEALQNQLREKERENEQAKEKLKILEKKLKEKEQSMAKLKTENTEIKSLQKNYTKKVTTPPPKKSNEKILKEIIEDDLQCSVCMEIFINPFILNCGHTFCEFCVGSCKQKDNLCPLCRRIIRGKHPNITLLSLINAVIEKLDMSPKKRREEMIKKREEAKKVTNKRSMRTR